jgi:CRP-like cAMP-binding protein
MSVHLLRKLASRDRSLSQKSLQFLSDSMGAARPVAANRPIVRVGSRPRQSTVIVSGWACRYSMLADGRRQMLGLHLAGDFVDLHSFPLKVMDHSVVSLTACTISSIEHESLQQITDSDPHLTRVLWMHTLIDAAILRRWLLSTGQRSSIEHAAHLICELHTRMQVVDLAAPGAPFELPLSQQQFGEALGISTVHVNRTLAEMRARNLLVWRGGIVEILDPAALTKLAEFDPTYLSLHDEPR